MKIIKPYYIIKTPIREHRDYMLKSIEESARLCYKSENCITEDSASEFVKRIIQVKKHESVAEHEYIKVRFIVDRGITHELVRHRTGIAYSQESTRYCNYSNSKFGGEITVISPFYYQEGTTQYNEWFQLCLECEKRYLNLINSGSTAQEARAVLPNSLKTEIDVTANIREWRHIFSLRAQKQAHPCMQQIMKPLLKEFQEVLPEFFSDIKES